jgi:hypothetical protein
MPSEIKGNQLRIRVEDPRLFKKETFRTHDVGRKGRLQRIAAVKRKTGKYATQSWRLNLKDYPSRKAAAKDIHSLRISNHEKSSAIAKLKTAI